MLCPSCGNTLSADQTQCPYCGRYFKNIISMKRKKKFLVWIWSLTLLVSMLALFTFFGEYILQFFYEVREKLGSFTPIVLLL